MRPVLPFARRPPCELRCLWRAFQYFPRRQQCPDVDAILTFDSAIVISLDDGLMVIARPFRPSVRIYQSAVDRTPEPRLNRRGI